MFCLKYELTINDFRIWTKNANGKKNLKTYDTRKCEILN